MTPEWEAYEVLIGQVTPPGECDINGGGCPCDWAEDNKMCPANIVQKALEDAESARDMNRDLLDELADFERLKELWRLHGKGRLTLAGKFEADRICKESEDKDDT
ncbi:MAG: hypothetical protein GY841_02855 [FCB group bacterium]|nr:hypothetical protein [FCB group bacterium]